MTRTDPAGEPEPRADTFGDTTAPGDAGAPEADEGLGEPEQTGAAKERTDRKVSRTKLARGVAVTLRQAIRILRWPTALLLLVPVGPILGTAWIATRTSGWDRVIVLVLLVVGAGITLAWAVRRHRYRAAVQDVEALTTELRALLEPSMVTDEAVDLLREVAARGGILLLRRLRAVWSLITFSDHLMDQSKGYKLARWFVPPTLATSGVLLTAHLWVVALSWPVFLVMAVMLATGVIGP